MRCMLFITRQVRTRKPWWKITRKPWSIFLPMATDVVHSNMASAVTHQGFRMACLTLSTSFLKSFLRIWVASRLNNRRSQGCGGTSGQNGEGSSGGRRLRGVQLTFSPILVLVILEDFVWGHRFVTSMCINLCNPW